LSLLDRITLLLSLAPSPNSAARTLTRRKGHLIRLAKSLHLPGPSRLVIALRWPNVDKNKGAWSSSMQHALS
jgi:hypothetical protein